MRWLVLFLLWIIILWGLTRIGYRVGVLGSPVAAGSVRYGCAPHGPVF